MKKNVLLFNLAGFTIVFLVSTVFLFYQVFTDAQSRKISVSQFFRPSYLSSAIKRLTQHDEPLLEDKIFFENKDGDVVTSNDQKVVSVPVDSRKEMFFIGTKKYLTSITPGNLKVIDIDTQQTFDFPIGLSGQFEVVGWADERHPILSKKDVNFSIIKFNLDTLASETLVFEIKYTGNSLSLSKVGYTTRLLYPECNPKCYLMEYDLTKNELVNKIPAFTEPSKTASLSDLTLLFFDSEKGYLAYQTTDSNEVYLIDRQLNLLQYIRLENDRDISRFISYIPQTQQMVFSLKEKNGNGQTIALVAANTPSLHVLTKVGADVSVRFSQSSGTYQLGEMLYDLNGHIVRRNLKSTLIQAY